MVHVIPKDSSRCLVIATRPLHQICLQKNAFFPNMPFHPILYAFNG